jgi:hypothetical protein
MQERRRDSLAPPAMFYFVMAGLAVVATRLILWSLWASHMH